MSNTSYREFDVWEGASGAVQVWQCPCGMSALEERDGLRCETCGRIFDDRGRRVVDPDQDDPENESPDADLGL